MEMVHQVSLVFLCSLCVGYCQGETIPGFDVASEAQLRSDLLTNYSAKIRPKDITEALLTFSLLTINDLETRNQMLSVSGFFTVVWEDSRLVWNTSAYSNIFFFFSDETEVWRPALVVKNAINDISVIADEDLPFRINNDGNIFWNPPGIYKTNCDIDTTYYPFDTQECSVMIQTWGYNLLELDLAVYGSGIETSEVQENGEWDLLNATSQRVTKIDGVDSNTYATISFEFRLKRRTTYYGLNIVLPVILLSTLSSLVFILPLDSGEKAMYSLTCLLSFAVFYTLISDRIPPTSKNTSYMALYLSVVLCMNGLAVMLTTFILNLNFREEPIPAWLSSLTRKILMPLLCVRGCQINNSDLVEDITPSNSIRRNDGQTKPKKETESSALNMNMYEDEITWKDVARYLDVFCFRSYSIAIAVITVVFYSIIGWKA